MNAAANKDSVWNEQLVKDVRGKIRQEDTATCEGKDEQAASSDGDGAGD